MLTTIDEVFHWLGTDRRNVPYHLHLLNLRWSPDGAEHDLQRYRELSQELKHTPEIIRLLIRDSNWRCTLIGNTVVILLRASEFGQDLVWRLTHSTWVAPQVAAGIALISTSQAKTVL